MTQGFVGYKHNNKIKGFEVRSDAYVSYLGKIMAGIFDRYTWEQIKTFFHNHLILDNEEDSDRVRCWDILEGDWTKTYWYDNEDKKPYTVMDTGDFYKDGLYCMYSYIFDLDCKNKTLLLFSNYGKHPYKGYEDWYNECGGSTCYIKPRGVLSSNKIPQGLTYYYMLLRMGSFDDDYQDAPKQKKQLRKALLSTPEELPTFMGISKDIDDIISIRLKGASRKT